MSENHGHPTNHHYHQQSEWLKQRLLLSFWEKLSVLKRVYFELFLKIHFEKMLK
jgi:hypothetical protein